MDTLQEHKNKRTELLFGRYLELKAYKILLRLKSSLRFVGADIQKTCTMVNDVENSNTETFRAVPRSIRLIHYNYF